MLALLIVGLVLLVPAVVLALPDPFSDPSGFAGGALDAISNSNWRLLGAFVVVGVVALIRKYGVRLGLGSGRAAWVTSIMLGALASLGAALEMGIALGGIIGVLKVLINGAITGLAASGMFSIMKSEKKDKEAALVA